jgi:hypothetical protein
MLTCIISYWPELSPIATACSSRSEGMLFLAQAGVDYRQKRKLVASAMAVFLYQGLLLFTTLSVILLHAFLKCKIDFHKIPH